MIGSYVHCITKAPLIAFTQQTISITSDLAFAEAIKF